MASSNRHWPSMFKSKPTNPTNQCSQYFSSNSPYTSGGDGERTPEPKPRWNPRPEQIRILEAIFNSGMVNPPRDHEIRKIRARLQEYGQVGDANVFYWFQNRKSRSKNKQRHHQKPPSTAATACAASTLSSSTLMNSPTNSVNQPNFYQSAASNQLLNEPSCFLCSSQGFNYPADLSSCDQGNCSNVFDDHQLMLMNHGPLRKDDQVIDKLPQQQIITPIVPHILQGPEIGGRPPQNTTVFINDVGYEVATAPFNVREAFGDEAVLIHPSGMPVLTNQSGLTHQPLQHGAFYYLINPPFHPSPHPDM
ncbi:hypothetical protein ACS0TY_018097 [Phlomoides rotata]